MHVQIRSFNSHMAGQLAAAAVAAARRRGMCVAGSSGGGRWARGAASHRESCFTARAGRPDSSTGS